MIKITTDLIWWALNNGAMLASLPYEYTRSMFVFWLCVRQLCRNGIFTLFNNKWRMFCITSATPTIPMPMPRTNIARFMLNFIAVSFKCVHTIWINVQNSPMFAYDNIHHKSCAHDMMTRLFTVCGDSISANIILDNSISDSFCFTFYSTCAVNKAKAQYNTT